MEAKGYVRRDRTMFVHVFRSVLDRDELIGRRLRSLAEMLCDGSLTPLLTHLARANDLTTEDRLALRAIFDEPDPETDTDSIDHGTDSMAKLTFGNAPDVPHAHAGQWAGTDGPLTTTMDAARRLTFHGIVRSHPVWQRVGRHISGGRGPGSWPYLSPPGLDA